MHIRSLCAALLCLSAPALAQTGTASSQSAVPGGAISDRIASILAEAPEGTRFGLVIQRLDGSEIVATAPDDRFIPASNTKIYTTLAAYRRLADLQRAAEGTGVRVEPAPGGAMDVILEGRGRGDLVERPDCRVQCLATLADAVAARTRRVRHVVGDASWYPDERWSAGMSWNNIPFRYGTATSALVIDDNEIAVTVVAGAMWCAWNDRKRFYYRIENSTRTVPGVESAIDIRRLPGSRTLVLDGTIGADAEPATYRLGVDDPAHRAAWRLARLLEQRGLTVSGDVTARYRPLLPSDDPRARGVPRAAPPREAMLAQLPPEPLGDDIVTINKQSQNLHAELMLRRVAKLEGSGSMADAEAALADLMEAANLPPDGFVLADGSGMSSYNRLSPRLTARLLDWAARQDWSETWRRSLPVGGTDGTLARRYAETALAGRIFAKTGSLNASRALSGYLTAASGEVLVFSAFANDIPPGGDGAAVAAMDAALLAVAAAY